MIIVVYMDTFFLPNIDFFLAFLYCVSVTVMPYFIHY